VVRHVLCVFQKPAIVQIGRDTSCPKGMAIHFRPDTRVTSALGKTRISFGAATFNGEQAVSFNVARVFNPTKSGIMPFMIGGISNSTGGETIFRIGGGFEF